MLSTLEELMSSLVCDEVIISFSKNVFLTSLERYPQTTGEVCFPETGLDLDEVSHCGRDRHKVPLVESLEAELNQGPTDQLDMFNPNRDSPTSESAISKK